MEEDNNDEVDEMLLNKDEDKPLLNEDEVGEVEQAVNAYLESKRTNEEEDTISSEDEYTDDEDEDIELVGDNILSVKSCVTRMTYDDIVNSKDPSIHRGIFIKIGEINHERIEVLPSINEEIPLQKQQLPSLNIGVIETSHENGHSVNEEEEENITHMEECNDTTSDKKCENDVTSYGDSHMEEETLNVHPTPIIVDTLNQNITSEEVKWLNKKNSELGIIGTQNLMTYLLMEAGCSVNLTTGTKGGRKKFTHLPTNLIVTSIKQDNNSCYVRYWDEKNITVSRFSGSDNTRQKNIARGG